MWELTLARRLSKHFVWDKMMEFLSCADTSPAMPSLSLSHTHTVGGSLDLAESLITLWSYGWTNVGSGP